MDYLWSPWRYSYVSKAEPSTGCLFCRKAAGPDDEESLVLHRAGRAFVLLNRFPYTGGHLMIAPYQHAATLEETPPESVAEMMLLARTAEARLREVYRPEGFNIGMNIGSCAGAGVAGHIHMHVVPRWCGDTNFMTVVGETRVLPEDLKTTYNKLVRLFRAE